MAKKLTMKPEEQNELIALACGKDPLSVSSPMWGGHGKNPHFNDYVNDLNAMNEAEERLDKDQRRKWEFTIAEMFSAPGQSWFDVCHMNAAQRAEAFLRTLGKWEEDK